MRLTEEEVFSYQQRYSLNRTAYYDRDTLLNEFVAKFHPIIEGARDKTSVFKSIDEAYSSWCDIFRGMRQSPESVQRQWGYIYARYFAPHRNQIVPPKNRVSSV